MQHHRSRLKLQINHKKQQIAVIICSSEEPAAESHEQPHSNRKPVFSKKFRSLPYRSICQHDGIMWSRNHRTGRHRLSASHAPRKQERVLYFKHARAASFSRWPQNRSAPDPPPHALTSQHVTEHARTHARNDARSFECKEGLRWRDHRHSKRSTIRTVCTIPPSLLHPPWRRGTTAGTQVYILLLVYILLVSMYVWWGKKIKKNLCLKTRKMLEWLQKINKIK